MDEEKLKIQMSNAAVWSGVTQIASKIVVPITNIILARILTPEAFGIVATFNVIISFANIFTDAGFQKYIIQHEFKSQEDLFSSLNVAFWTNFIFSCLIWIDVFVCRGKIASLMGIQGNEEGVIIACLVIPFTSFSSIQTALFGRNFNYKVLFWVKLITSIIPLVVTVPLAIYFRNYWALVWGTIIKEAVQAILLTWMSPWKPKLMYSRKQFISMFSFSVWTLLEQIAIWLTGNIDILFVTQLFNQYYVGIYKTSMSTVSSIFSLLHSALTPILFAALSRSQNCDNRFRAIYYKFQRLTAILIIPLGVGSFLYRNLITEILLGAQWKEASGFIGIWSLALCCSIVFSYYNSEVIRSKGQPKLSLVIQICALLGISILFNVGKEWDFKDIYIGRSFIPIIMIATSSIIVYKKYRISIFTALKNLFPIFVSTGGMAILGIVLQKLSNNTIFQLASILICVGGYFTILFLFPNMREEIKSVPFVTKILNKLKSLINM